jgi:hypothetical protein
MNGQNVVRPRPVTVVGLVVGAVGIAILWAAGVEFPIYPPPGILGLFVTVGFLVSGGYPTWLAGTEPVWPSATGSR